MVDFETEFRHYGYRYNAPEQRQAVSTYRDINRQAEPLVFKTPRVEVHDCRPECLKDLSDPRRWDAWLFKQGLNDTCHSVKKIRQKEGAEEEDADREGKHKEHRPRPPDKLLYNIGRKGSSKGNFNFPRDLTVDAEGNLLIADSRNNRVQKFNQCGVFMEASGEKGKGQGQFNEPTSVAVMENTNVLVADRRNKRIQVFTENWTFKYEFSTVDEPYFVACDVFYNIVVATSKGTIEIYRRQGILQYRFSLCTEKGNRAAPRIALNNKDEVIVSDSVDRKIKFFTYSGKLLYEFEPSYRSDGLAVVPAGMCINPLGHVIVADCLNHTVNQYSERGVLLEQLIGPNDSAGAMQGIVLGPEGHLSAIEYTGNGPHCLKIFRYSECECHRTRPATGASGQ